MFFVRFLQSVYHTVIWQIILNLNVKNACRLYKSVILCGHWYQCNAKKCLCCKRCQTQYIIFFSIILSSSYDEDKNHLRAKEHHQQHQPDDSFKNTSHPLTVHGYLDLRIVCQNRNHLSQRRPLFRVRPWLIKTKTLRLRHSRNNEHYLPFICYKGGEF